MNRIATQHTSLTDASKALGNLTALAGVVFAEDLPQRQPISDRDAAERQLVLGRALAAYGTGLRRAA